MVACPSTPNGIVLYFTAASFAIFKMLIPAAMWGIEQITDGRNRIEMPKLHQLKLSPWDTITLLNQKAQAWSLILYLSKLFFLIKYLKNQNLKSNLFHFLNLPNNILNSLFFLNDSRALIALGADWNISRAQIEIFPGRWLISILGRKFVISKTINIQSASKTFSCSSD